MLVICSVFYVLAMLTIVCLLQVFRHLSQIRHKLNTVNTWQSFYVNFHDISELSVDA